MLRVVAFVTSVCAAPTVVAVTYATLPKFFAISPMALPSYHFFNS